MAKIAILGGTCLPRLQMREVISNQEAVTPFGKPSENIILTQLSGQHVYFLNRHGKDFAIPPHKINYRANIWALKEQGVDLIISFTSVGSISDYSPGALIIPHQLVDYSYGREHSFYDGSFFSRVEHVDFTVPFYLEIAERLITAAESIRLPVRTGAVYAVSQGPRLESAAEIDRMRRDGCDIVGMTLMPEAALARELDIKYTNISLVVNRAAGCSGEKIDMDAINHTLEAGRENIQELLCSYLSGI